MLVTATLFGRGWMTELPSTCFCSLFIHYMESLLTKAWKSLIIMTGLCLIPGLNNSILMDQLIESTYMRLGHEPGRATCLFVKCPDYEQLGTPLHRLCEVSSSLNRMSENVLTTAKGQKEENFRQTSTSKTAEHIATC